MRAHPTISVVTVVRNNLGGLVIASDSLARQSYREVEHVVVDGASTDGTGSWLADHSPDHPVRWVSEPDSGLFDAMNKGIGMCSGDLVVFMNGGDAFTHDHVTRFVADEWTRGEWRWGYGSVRHVDAGRRPVKGFANAPFSRRKFELGLTWVPHQSTYMQRQLLEELEGFRPGFGIAADQELLMRASQVARPAVWIEYLADYLMGGVHEDDEGLRSCMLWHAARTANDVPLLGHSVADLGFSVCLAGWKDVRKRLGRAFPK